MAEIERQRYQHAGPPICDFCSAPPLWLFPAEHFDMGTNVFDPAIVHRSESDWAACQECHDLIQAEDRQGLAERTLTTIVRKAEVATRVERRRIERTARPATLDLHDRFRANRTGPPIPIRPTVDGDTQRRSL